MVAICPPLDAVVVRLGHTPEPQPTPAHLPPWRKRVLDALAERGASAGTGGASGRDGSPGRHARTRGADRPGRGAGPGGRRRSPPSSSAASDPPRRSAPGTPCPAQVDRADFARPDAPWLVAVFTSATCSTCAGVWERAQPLASDAVAVQEVEHGRDRALHDRYGIDAVPATLVVDADGRGGGQLRRTGDGHRPVGGGRRGARAGDAPRRAATRR